MRQIAKIHLAECSLTGGLWRAAFNARVTNGRKILFKLFAIKRQQLMGARARRALRMQISVKLETMMARCWELLILSN